MGGDLDGKGKVTLSLRDNETDIGGKGKVTLNEMGR